MHYTIRCVILYHALYYTMHYTIPRTILATNLKLLQSAPTKSYREASNSSTSLIIARGPVAQWIRHRPTEPGIAGSSPAGVIAMVHQERQLSDEAEGKERRRGISYLRLRRLTHRWLKYRIPAGSHGILGSCIALNSRNQEDALGAKFPRLEHCSELWNVLKSKTLASRNLREHMEPSKD